MDLTNLPDSSKTYELASVIGVEAGRFYAACVANPEPSLVSNYMAIVRQHDELLPSFPDVLVEKQEIVNIALTVWAALSNFIDADADDRAEHLLKLSSYGKVAAIRRKNAIFYSQMLMAEWIAASISGRGAEFAFGGVTGISGLARADIGLEHEGIFPLLRYAENADPSVASKLRSVHLAATVGSRDLLTRASLLNVAASEQVFAISRLSDVFGVK